MADINIEAHEALLKMYLRLKDEHRKGVTRMIAVIREEARAFDKAHPEIPEGVFLKYAKMYIQEGVEWPESFQRALNYL